MTSEVQKIMTERGCSRRQAYRLMDKGRKREEPVFNYDNETPKGEWV